jgi:hypothetical protein
VVAIDSGGIRVPGPVIGSRGTPDMSLSVPYHRSLDKPDIVYGRFRFNIRFVNAQR